MLVAGEGLGLTFCNRNSTSKAVAACWDYIDGKEHGLNGKRVCKSHLIVFHCYQIVYRSISPRYRVFASVLRR